MGRYSIIRQAYEHPAALGPAVVGEGPPGIPTQPEGWLIGRIEKPKTCQKKEDTRLRVEAFGKDVLCYRGNKLLEPKLTFSWDRDPQVPDFKTDENASSS